MIPELTPFVVSLNFALEELTGLTVVNAVVSETYKEPEILSDITVRIDLNNMANPVFVLLTGSAETARLLASLILGKTNLSDTSPLLPDILGEILNTIVGATQKSVSLHYDFSTPKKLNSPGQPLESVYKGEHKSAVSFFRGGELSLYLVEGIAA